MFSRDGHALATFPIPISSSSQHGNFRRNRFGLPPAGNGGHIFTIGSMSDDEISSSIPASLEFAINQQNSISISVTTFVVLTCLALFSIQIEAVFVETSTSTPPATKQPNGSNSTFINESFQRNLSEPFKISHASMTSFSCFLPELAPIFLTMFLCIPSIVLAMKHLPKATIGHFNISCLICFIANFFNFIWYSIAAIVAWDVANGVGDKDAFRLMASIITAVLAAFAIAFARIERFRCDF